MLYYLNTLNINSITVYKMIIYLLFLQCKTINVKDCHNIKSIHPLSNGEQFIMAAKNGLFIANTNGENPQDILSGKSPYNEIL